MEAVTLDNYDWETDWQNEIFDYKTEDLLDEIDNLFQLLETV